MSVNLITGASTGIGYVTAKELAADGHAVWASMRDPQGRNRKTAAEFAELTHTDEQTLQRNWLLNTTASLVLTRAAVPAMIEKNRGGVILVASGLAFSGGSGRPDRPSPYRTLYASAKAALEFFSRTMAEELDDPDVTITVLCSPRTSTEWNSATYQGDHFMTPGDVASAALSAFERGEVICLPGLSDTTTWEHFLTAERAVLDGNAHPELAPQYR